MLYTGPWGEGPGKPDAATVYFGKDDQDQPAAWRVIGYDGSGAAGETGKATLLAREPMGVSEFSSSSSDYRGSDLQAKMNAFGNLLSSTEAAAVIQRELNENRGGVSV